MEQSTKHIDILISEYRQYMEQRGYVKGYVCIKERELKKLRIFMEMREETVYSPEICRDFIANITSNGKRSDSAAIRKISQTPKALLEYAHYGFTAVRNTRRIFRYSGEIGEHIRAYIAYREQHFAKATVTSDRIYLERFNDYLKARECLRPHALTAEIILDFSGCLSDYSRSTIYCTLSAIRLFLAYLYEKGFIQSDLSIIVPKNSYRSEEKLPSLYSKEEVEKLLDSVDRKSPMGKRDYAIILLAARLGVRASDISGLEFASIDWQGNTISIIQQKTGKPANFPLLPEIGNAIIDYLKYARPVSDSRHIFLRTQSPYCRLNAGSMYNLANRCFASAGICSKRQRKRGLHALRHSLAGRLLENKTPYPVMTEVLSHATPETAREYIRVDMQALVQCALPVPAASFYSGGTAE